MDVEGKDETNMSAGEESGDMEPVKDENEDQVSSTPASSEEDESSSASSSDEDEQPDSRAAPVEPSSSGQTDADGNQLSAYELQRLERIRRNQQYLKQLGLENGALPKKPAGTGQRKRRKKEKVVAAPRSSLSRSLKRQVNYAELRARRNDFGHIEKNDTKRPRKEKAKNRMNRMDRVVYDEFQRLSTEAKQALKTAESDLRQAKVEHRHAKKVHQSFAKKERKRIEVERRLEETARERKWFGGKTKKETLQTVDRRMSDMLLARAKHYRAQHHNLTQSQREDKERRVKMIDALDRFPVAVQEATNVLNFLLVQRSPKDPPPPRRGTRKRQGQEDAEVDSSPPTPAPNPTWSRASLPAGTSQPTLQPAEPNNEELPPKKSTGAKRKEFQVRNVGGWVSPEFGACVDRTWLEADCPSSTYVPQVGDTVLYYPAGHQAFNNSLPDIAKTTRNRYRMPLLERAKKAFHKKQKEANATAKSTKEECGDQTEETKNADSEPRWYNEAWLSSDGRYPILCRVEKTHAEFPPDPNATYKVVQKEDDGAVKVVWALPAPGKKEEKKLKKPTRKQNYSPHLHLVVQLNPLSPVLPPSELGDESGSLALPPKFSVATFPSKVAPFIVPFAWAYRRAHSFAVGDSAKKGDWIGKVSEFSRHGTGTDNNRSALDDCTVPELLSALDTRGPEFIAKAIESSQSSRSNPIKLPFVDVCVVTDFIIGRMKRTTAVAPNDSQSIDSDALANGLVTLIHNTLPMWNEVTVARQGKRKQRHSAWELDQCNGNDNGLSPTGLFPSIKTSYHLDTGLVHNIDEPLRAKIECTIEDFIKDTGDASLFVPPVTDEVAPSYSCAVPLGMCFERILRRLGRGSRVGGKSHTPFYYRSVEALLSDMSDIGYNCMLYNSPDSEVSEKVVEIIPLCKKAVTQVSSRHLREKEAREKADEERRRVIALQCHSSAETQQTIPDSSSSPGRVKSSLKNRPLVAPFTKSLNRSWLQDVHPDSSWLKNGSDTPQPSANDNSESGKAEAALPCGTRKSARGRSHVPQGRGAGNVETTYWVPQSGDMILYSRAFHSVFVKNHYKSLTMEQCMMPRFSAEKPSSLESESIDDALKSEPGGQDTCWVVGRVMWIRASFPDPRSDGDETFAETAPVLALGVNFNYSWLPNPILTIHWRPCLLGSEGPRNRPNREPTDNVNQVTHLRICEACGLGREASFLRPAWAPLDQQMVQTPHHGILFPDGMSEASVLGHPVGLNADEVDALDRCFSFLKRRTLGNIAADYVDPKFCMDNVKRGFYPTAKAGSRLPTFERLLSSACVVSDDRRKKNAQIQVRGEQISVEESQRLLAGVHYLPPWSSEPANLPASFTNGKKKPKVRSQYHDTISPIPNLCLELIQMRLRNGYYRGISAVIHDIQEAYVVSVLQILAKPAAQKAWKAVSVMKIARALLSGERYGNLDQARVAASSKKKKVILSEEEVFYKNRIDKIRTLYATAVVCAAETSTVELIFGITRTNRAKQKRRTATTPKEDGQIVAIRQKLDTLISTFSRDPCLNRIPPLASIDPLPSVKVMIKGIYDTIPEERQADGSDGNGDLAPIESDDAGTKGAQPLDMTKPIVFEPRDYAASQPLIRTFFGRFGRMEACARCQANHRSMLVCRVRKGHSNADFDWIGCLRGTGGVDSLINALANPQGARSISVPYSNHLGPRSELVARDQNRAAVSAKPRNEESKDETASTTESADEPEEKKTDGDVSTKMEIQPSVVLGWADVALEMAREAVVKATATAKAPPKLSEEFIKVCFPVDPSDGKYTYCIVCGLSGDVMCCEGCPNVSHAHCANLSEIPEGDWYCSKCQDKGTAEEKSEEIIPVGGASDEADATIEVENNDDKPGDNERLSFAQQRVSAQNLPLLRRGKAPPKSLGDILDDLRAVRVRSAESATEQEQATTTATDGVDESNDMEGGKQKVALGTKIVKKFGRLGDFEGKVTKLPTAIEPYYAVRYTDGDEEDMSEDELNSHLVPTNDNVQNSVQGKGRLTGVPQSTATLNQPTKRGRGRPRKEVNTLEQPIKRKRGRPRKGVQVHSVEPPKKRKRGRPRKLVQHTSST